MNFEIYQIKSIDETIRERFVSYRFLTEKLKKHPDPENYELVYQGRSEDFVKNHPDKEQLLEQLYIIFNNSKYPEGYEGRSMSVSDVVVLDDGNTRETYYTDSIGFIDITKYWEPERQ